MIKYGHKWCQILFLFCFFFCFKRFTLRILEPWEQALGVSFQCSCHCGSGMCSSLSLDFQHMCGWPCTGSYSNLRAIDSNSPFLLTRSFISPPPRFKNDPQTWSKDLRSVVAHTCIIISLSSTFSLVVWRASRSKLFSGGKPAIKDCSDATATSLSSIQTELHRANLQTDPSGQSLVPNPSPHFILTLEWIIRIRMRSRSWESCGGTPRTWGVKLLHSELCLLATSFSILEIRLSAATVWKSRG